MEETSSHYLTFYIVLLLTDTEHILHPKELLSREGALLCNKINVCLNSSKKKSFAINKQVSINLSYKHFCCCPLKQNFHLNYFFSTITIFWYKTRDNLNHLEILGNLH